MRRAEDLAEGLARPLNRVLEAPKGEAGANGGQLDRDVVDVGLADQIDDRAPPAGRLRMAEHRLTQEVDVDREAIGTKSGQMRTQCLWGGVSDQVANQGTQPLARQSHDRPGRRVRDTRSGPQQRHVGSRQERGAPPRREPLQLAGRDAGEVGRRTRSQKAMANATDSGSLVRRASRAARRASSLRKADAASHSRASSIAGPTRVSPTSSELRRAPLAPPTATAAPARPPGPAPAAVARRAAVR